MAEGRRFQESKIVLVSKEDFQACIIDALKKVTGRVVIMIIGMVDEQEIWSEIEIESEEAVEWIMDLSKSCSITLVHFSEGDILNESWRIK